MGNYTRIFLLNSPLFNSNAHRFGLFKKMRMTDNKNPCVACKKRNIYCVKGYELCNR